MDELKVLLSKLSQSDQIKSYLNRIKDSLVLIKRCVVIIVFLAGLMVFLKEYTLVLSIFTSIGTETRAFKAEWSVLRRCLLVLSNLKKDN